MRYNNHIAILLIYNTSSPHLLAPTASDLRKYGVKNTILAGFHTDLNFLTIHGQSRYPGLNIWARNTGKRIPVTFPKEGKFLLVQVSLSHNLIDMVSVSLDICRHSYVYFRLMFSRQESNWSI